MSLHAPGLRRDPGGPHRLHGCGLSAAILLLATAACEAPASAPEVVVRDSAGVRIVETASAVRFPAPITIPDTQAVRIGAVAGDPEYLLSRVVGAMQLPNGEILIGNRGTNELRFYDPQGQFLRSEGREGEGPGEYEYLRALGRCRADGFVAFDLSWQINSYDAEGRFLDKTVLRAPDGRTPYNVACDPHGHFLILGWGRTATEEGPRIGFYETRARLLLTSREGELATDFGERLVSERIGSTGGSRPHPAGRATVFALHDDVVYVGSGETFEIELRDLDGELRSLLRGPSIPLETTDSVRAAYLERALSLASPERRPAVRRQVGEWDWPPRVPAYTALVVDPDGTAWLRAFRIDPEEPEVWSLLDPARGYMGDVTLRPGQTLLDVGRDYLLLLERDARDVESVVRVDLPG